jgi:hypothetical protein
MDGLGALAGMGAEDQTIPGLLGQAAQLLLKAVQVAQGQGNQPLVQELATLMAHLTDIGMADMQGMGAGPMAGNGLGTPPGPGPMPAQAPAFQSPGQGMPTPMMLPRSSMM